MNILNLTETCNLVAVFLWIELLFHGEMIQNKIPRLGTLIWEPQTKQYYFVILLALQGLGQQTFFQKLYFQILLHNRQNK